MADKRHEFFDGAIEMYNHLSCYMDGKHIDWRRYFIDHACYRVETMKRYREVCHFLEQRGQLLSENDIGGRLISTFKLDEPFKLAAYYVDLVEVPAPKEESFYPEGWQHIECVIDDMSLHEFVSLHPQIAFKTKKIDDTRNPDVSFKYTVGDREYAVKFHLHSLEDVIRAERNQART